MKLSIVSTLYCSEGHLPEFVGRVRLAASALTEDWELLLVNDGSPDGSLAVALEERRRDPRVAVLDLSRNFGHHPALLAGLEAADGDLVFLVDSDLEEDPGLLAAFHEELRRTGADVVFGVQETRKGGLVERLGGALFFAVFNALASPPLPRNLSTVRLMTKPYVEALRAFRETETVIAGLWALAGFDQRPLTIQKTSRRSSTYRLARRAKVLVDAITSFSARPLVLVFWMGLVISAAAGLASLWLVVRRLFFGTLLAGWPSVIVSIWLMGGLLMFCVGLVGLYVSRVFQEVKARPRTIVKRVYRGSGSPAA